MTGGTIPNVDVDEPALVADQPSSSPFVFRLLLRQGRGPQRPLALMPSADVPSAVGLCLLYVLLAGWEGGSVQDMLPQ